MELTITREYWEKVRPFRIAREVMSGAELVAVEVTAGGFRGRGECCPTAHYGETTAGTIADLESLRAVAEEGQLDRQTLQALLPASAARNALDCALWDLEAKRTGIPVWQLLKQGSPRPLVTAFTLGIDSPENMAAEARDNASRPLLKIKLGAPDDVERVTAVRAAAADARLIIDANEAWTFAELQRVAPKLAELGVELIEQPLPASRDHELEGYDSPVPLCADESCHTADDLASLVGRYQFVNIKLDKTGGLTEALKLAVDARRLGLKLMVGCMAGTSLAMAPALLIAPSCDFVDLDAPLLQKRDRIPGLRYECSLVHPAAPELWG